MLNCAQTSSKWFRVDRAPAILDETPFQRDLNEPAKKVRKLNLLEGYLADCLALIAPGVFFECFELLRPDLLKKDGLWGNQHLFDSHDMS